MAIQSSSFGPVILTGEDAEAFKRQLQEPARPEAVRLVQRAQSMAKEFFETGQVTVKPNTPAPL